jgi:hypothetical protein
MRLSLFVPVSLNTDFAILRYSNTESMYQRQVYSDEVQFEGNATLKTLSSQTGRHREAFKLEMPFRAELVFHVQLLSLFLVVLTFSWQQFS